MDINKKKNIKVAFVVPFGYEAFFNDSRDIFKEPKKFEDEVISRRNTWHINWCKAMRSAGMDVTIYHLSRYANEEREYVHKEGFTIKRFPTDFRGFWYKEEFSIKLLRGLKKDLPDIVFSVTHIFGEVIDMYDILSFYCYFNNIKLVARNPYSDTYSLIYKNVISANGLINSILPKNFKINKLQLSLKLLIHKSLANLKLLFKSKSLKCTKIIISQTELDFNNLQEFFGINVQVRLFTFKPVDLTNFNSIPTSEAKSKLNLNDNTKYLLHVSNLFNTKGAEHLINILQKLNDVYNEVDLIVSGGGNKKEELIELATQKGVIEKCNFIGQINHDDLVMLYNAADIFVLPTKIFREGQPNVIMEALACNTPVITTNLPGPSSIITEGLGLLVNVGDEEELFNAICKVLDGNFKIDQDKRNKFLNNYSIESVGKALRNYFEEILSNN